MSSPESAASKPRAPRRRMVEQAPTWRKGQQPEVMLDVVEGLVRGERRSEHSRVWTQEEIQQVVLRWVAVAGDVHSAALARLVLNLDERGEPRDDGGMPE